MWAAFTLGLWNSPAICNASHAHDQRSELLPPQIEPAAIEEDPYAEGRFLKEGGGGDPSDVSSSGSVSGEAEGGPGKEEEKEGGGKEEGGAKGEGEEEGGAAKEIEDEADVVSRSWIDVLRNSGRWTVLKKYKGVPGVYLFRDSQTLACFLMAQKVCHFWSQGAHYSGHWYSLAGHNLPRVVDSEDACGHAARGLPPGFTSKHIGSTLGMEEKMGRFLSRAQRNALLPQGLPAQMVKKKRGVAAPHDSFLGHFVERVGGLAEISEALTHSLAYPGAQFPLSAMSVHFGTDTHVGTFAGNVSQLLFGREADMVPGRGRPHDAHVCFEEALFPLNIAFSRETAEAFKKRAYSRVDEVAGLVPKPNQHFFQVTWLWRSNRRTISNHGEVMDIIMRQLSGLSIQVVEFSESMSFWETVAVMRRSAFALGMHGSAISNIIFMPAGASFLELVPLKYRYHPHAKTGHFYNLKYKQWTNTHLENASFDNNCFKKDWHEYSSQECWENKNCLHCVRDHSITVVHAEEFNQTLARIVVDVRSWIRNMTVV